MRRVIFRSARLSTSTNPTSSRPILKSFKMDRPYRRSRHGPQDLATEPVLPLCRSTIDYDNGTKIERSRSRKSAAGPPFSGPLAWAGPVDQYFAAIFLPDDPSNAALVTQRNRIRVPKNPDKPDPNDVVAIEVLGGPSAILTAIRASGVCRSQGARRVGFDSSRHRARTNETSDLRPLIDFGWFSFISRPLFAALRWTHHTVTSNWGWAIILLTVVINLALLPLRITSMKSALKTKRFNRRSTRSRTSTRSTRCAIRAARR